MPRILLDRRHFRGRVATFEKFVTRSLLASLFVVLPHFTGAFNLVLAEELVLDAILASVDGKPITLQDLSARMPGRALSVNSLSQDVEARQVLEGIIFEELVLAEGSVRNLQPSEQEIDSYIDEVAKRNQMTRAEFNTALSEQGKNAADYRRMVTLEIIRGRIVSQIARGSATVSKEEIDAYVRNRPEANRKGSKIKLRQILISSESRSEDEARELIDDVVKRFKSGDSFEELAEDFSESPDASEGGLLGVVVQEDLQREVFDALYGLSEGQISEPLKMSDGYRIFFVEDKIGNEDKIDQGLVDEARKQLENQKSQSQVQAFFREEIQRKHSIERKL